MKKWSVIWRYKIDKRVIGNVIDSIILFNFEDEINLTVTKIIDII